MTDFNLPSKAGQDTQNQYLSQIAQDLGVTASRQPALAKRGKMLKIRISGCNCTASWCYSWEPAGCYYMANHSQSAAATRQNNRLGTRFQTLTAEQQQDLKLSMRDMVKQPTGTTPTEITQTLKRTRQKVCKSKVEYMG